LKIYRVVQKLGRTRFPISPPEAVEKWQNYTPAPSDVKFSKLISPCSGCRACEMMCAFYMEGKNNPTFSRIRIASKLYEWLKDEADFPYEVKVCKQCPGEAPCLKACPMGALERDAENGAIIVNDKLCIRCKRCVEACPYDAIWYNEDADKILKCTLCSGRSRGPVCVEVCPIQCLTLEKLVANG
jgi:Fe-S-cluster-containing hydrogenase component 2